MKKWLYHSGVETDSLSKERVEELLEGELDEEVKGVLNIRQELSKTSIKKYEAMDRALGRDGRIRGLFQFYGANRTGRWAGRLVQVKNGEWRFSGATGKSMRHLRRGCLMYPWNT
jgi:DNA polymerase